MCWCMPCFLAHDTAPGIIYNWNAFFEQQIGIFLAVSKQAHYQYLDLQDHDFSKRSLQLPSPLVKCRANWQLLVRHRCSGGESLVWNTTPMRTRNWILLTPSASGILPPTYHSETSFMMPCGPMESCTPVSDFVTHLYLWVSFISEREENRSNWVDQADAVSPW